MSIWNAAPGARVGLAGLAGFGLMIMSASLAEANYGPRTIIGENYQQTSFTSSIDSITEAQCHNTNGCTILFRPAPEQKRLIVQHVSCAVEVSSGTVRFATLRTRKGQSFPLRETYLTPVNTTDRVWNISSAVTHLIESREIPLVALASSAGAAWFLKCNISGQLVDS